MIREVISDTLLALAVLTVAASAIGVAIAPNPYARLHYVTPAAVVAPVLVALAVLVAEGLDQNTGETVVALVFLVAAAPLVSHATIRATRIREEGNWRGHPPAKAEPEQEKLAGEADVAAADQGAHARKAS